MLRWQIQESAWHGPVWSFQSFRVIQGRGGGNNCWNRQGPASKCPPEESGLYFALAQYEIINKVLRGLALKYHEHQKEESKLFHTFMYAGFYHAVAELSASLWLGPSVVQRASGSSWTLIGVGYRFPGWPQASIYLSACLGIFLVKEKQWYWCYCFWWEPGRKCLWAGSRKCQATRRSRSGICSWNDWMAMR